MVGRSQQHRDDKAAMGSSCRGTTPRSVGLPLTGSGLKVGYYITLHAMLSVVRGIIQNLGLCDLLLTAHRRTYCRGLSCPSIAVSEPRYWRVVSVVVCFG